VSCQLTSTTNNTIMGRRDLRPKLSPITYAGGLLSSAVYPGDQLVIVLELVPNIVFGIWHYNAIDTGPVSESTLSALHLKPGPQPTFRIIAHPVPEFSSIVLLVTVALLILRLLWRWTPATLFFRVSQSERAIV
jgi:hypothetical protein